MFNIDIYVQNINPINTNKKQPHYDYLLPCFAFLLNLVYVKTIEENITLFHWSLSVCKCETYRVLYFRSRI